MPTPKAPTLDDAIALATECHQGQVDKAGVDYIQHPLAVMDSVNALYDKMVAVLHDTVEDTGLTLSDLRDRGYPEEVVRAIDAITKRPGESRESYYRRIKANPRALRVKEKDIAHNLSRLEHLSPQEQEQLRAKYGYAKQLLGISDPAQSLRRSLTGVRRRTLGMSLDEAVDLLSRGDPDRRVQVDVRWRIGGQPRVRVRADRGVPADVVLTIRPEPHEPGVTRNGPRGSQIIRSTAAGAADRLGV